MIKELVDKLNSMLDDILLKQYSGTRFLVMVAYIVFAGIMFYAIKEKYHVAYAYYLGFTVISVVFVAGYIALVWYGHNRIINRFKVAADRLVRCNVYDRILTDNNVYSVLERIKAVSKRIKILSKTIESNVLFEDEEEDVRAKILDSITEYFNLVSTLHESILESIAERLVDDVVSYIFSESEVLRPSDAMKILQKYLDSMETKLVRA